MGIQVTVPPVDEPITLDEAKAQCRVETDDENDLITGYIVAAREWCEKFDWRAFLTQTLELWLDAWPASGEIELPRPPLQSVISVDYYDTDDVQHTLQGPNTLGLDSVYQVDDVNEPGHVVLRYHQAWPTTTLRPRNAICVTYVAGWEDAAHVPQTIKQAIHLLVGFWHENREDATVGAVSRSIEMGAKALLGVDRAFRF